jgi:hypothetical protein
MASTPPVSNPSPDSVEWHNANRQRLVAIELQGGKVQELEQRRQIADQVFLDHQAKAGTQSLHVREGGFRQSCDRYGARTSRSVLQDIAYYLGGTLTSILCLSSLDDQSFSQSYI